MTPSRWRKNRAFEYFNAKGKNPVWSWSARSADGGTVVLALWKDLFVDRSGQATYSEFGRANLAKWTKKPGNRERIENLKLATGRCGGRFHVVVAVPKDKNIDASPREAACFYPEPGLVMRIRDFDEKTGEFSAEQVS